MSIVLKALPTLDDPKVIASLPASLSRHHYHHAFAFHLELPEVTSEAKPVQRLVCMHTSGNAKLPT